MLVVGMMLSNVVVMVVDIGCNLMMVLMMRIRMMWIMRIMLSIVSVTLCMMMTMMYLADEEADNANDDYYGDDQYEEEIWEEMGDKEVVVVMKYCAITNGHHVPFSEPVI